MKKTIFFISLLLIPFSISAQVYKCKENGKTIFSDQPCGKNTEVIKEAPYSKMLQKENAGDWTPAEERQCKTNLDEIYRTSGSKKYIVGELTKARIESIQRNSGNCIAVKIVMTELYKKPKKKRY